MPREYILAIEFHGYRLVTYSREQLLSGSGYVWGIPLMIICFAAMQRTVLAIYGLGYKFVIANVKKKLRRTA